MTPDTIRLRFDAYEACVRELDIRDARADRAFDRVGQTMQYLSALLTVRESQCRQSGLIDEATAMERLRNECREPFLMLQPDDRRGSSTLMERYLPVIEQLLFESRWTDERSAVAETFARNVSRPYEPTKALLRSLWPWSERFVLLNRGWGARFGVELLDDMQTIIDLGLTGFEVDDVKEKYGSLHVYFENCPYDFDEERERPKSWLSLAGCMDDLLDLYESLSTAVCIGCGSFGPIRANLGWILPLCRYCAHANPHDNWTRMPKTDGSSLALWAMDNSDVMLRECFADLHIHALLRQRDEAVQEMPPSEFE